jgi:ABC-type methionine transport system ATPase subunit
MKHNLNKLMHLANGKGEDSAPLELLDSSTEMDLMKRLKHIRRELHVILRVITEQKNVIEQLSERINPTGHSQASPQYPMGEKAAERAEQRIHKLEKRKIKIEALDAKAAHIFKDVSRFTRREITVCG